MAAEFEYLDVEDLIALASVLLGDPPPVRDIGLLDASAARPRARAFGQDAYSNIWTKAAAFLQSVVTNLALIDGNKRLGWLATAVFLELNAVAVTKASNDGVHELVVDVAGGQLDVEQIASRLKRTVSRRGR